MLKTVYIINCPPGWLKTAPLSLVYLRSYLEANGVDARAIDLNIALFQLFNFSKSQWLNLNDNFERSLFSESENAFSDFFQNVYKRLENADIIGFSLSRRNAHFSFSLARRIKEKFPAKRIVFGGPQALFLDRQNMLDKDYTWVIGEGEIPFRSIAQDDARRVFRYEEIENLDTLPFLDFQPFNLKSYQPVLPIFSSRGCHFKCSFCSERLLYQKLRRHSPQYMQEEIRALAIKHSIGNFVFCDSMINSDNAWLEDFCRRLTADDIKVSWEAQLRIAPGFPRELASLIRQSGCFNLFIGLESGSADVLNLMHKGFTPEIALEFFDSLKSAGLQFEISLIFGYPGETEKDFEETAQFILTNKHLIPKIAQVNPFVDYLDEFPGQNLPSPEGLERVDRFIRMLDSESIKYTRSFINNLVY